ncbi:Sec-independent protein translocase subunit TatA [Moraxella oblonga]|uniref:Sec-independent protein translocase subunit TatA n=1 Tax=Moraxella oblonga TaxID=200413 RepID=UPI000831AAD3|nr:Sec-independent protein translocase subunit TatA [Moraxella oblonga]
MGSFSVAHWLILLVVVVVIFGTSKLKNAGKDIGQAVKGFKDAVKDEEKPALSQAQEIKVEEVKVKKDETV